MEIEIEVTETKKQLVKLETPAYFLNGHRQSRITDENIVEVHDTICIVDEKANKFSSYYEKLDKIVKCPVSTKLDFETALQSLLNKIAK